MNQDLETDDEYDSPRAPSSTELAMERTDMAFERSLLASDRTTMGYMRTAISLVGFGFSIPALFQILTGVPGLENASIERARFLGLFMLILAVFMLSTAVLQQFLFLRRLARIAGKSFPVSITLISCVVVLVIAVFATVSILMRIGPV